MPLAERGIMENEELKRIKQGVLDKIGTNLEMAGSAIGGAYGLDLDNETSRHIVLAKLMAMRKAADEAVGLVHDYARVKTYGATLPATLPLSPLTVPEGMES